MRSRGACRVIQKEIEQQLKDRGLAGRLMFDAKLKSRGLLDVQSVKIGSQKHIGRTLGMRRLPEVPAS